MIRALALVLLLTSQTFAAISADTVFEVRTTGSDTNGGGFVTAASGTDWSQQDAAQYSVTNGVTNGTTTVTSATANFGTDVVGNIMYVQGGTAPVTAGWYQITARASTTSITVDRSIVASTGTTLRIGGALASPGMYMGAFVSVGGFGADCYVKAGTYSITSTTQNISGGTVNLLGAGTNIARLEGYQTTRGDLGTKPVFSAGVNGSGQMIATGGNGALVNIELNLNSKTGWTAARGMTTGDRTMFCKFTGAWSIGINAANPSFGYFNWASGCVTGFSINTEYGSIATGCTTSGFIVSGNATHCIDNASPIGFSLSANSSVKNCTAFGGTGVGFSLGSSTSAWNCLAYGRGGKGFTQSTSTNVMLVNCAGGSNVTANEDIITAATTNMGFKYGFITLSANPFTNSAGGVFTLNNTAGGGALLRATGAPSQFQDTLTSNSIDIGASQVLATGSGGGSFTFIK